MGIYRFVLDWDCEKKWVVKNKGKFVIVIIYQVQGERNQGNFNGKNQIVWVMICQIKIFILFRVYSLLVFSDFFGNLQRL